MAHLPDYPEINTASALRAVGEVVLLGGGLAVAGILAGYVLGMLLTGAYGQETNIVRHHGQVYVALGLGMLGGGIGGIVGYRWAFRRWKARQEPRRGHRS